MIDRENPTRWFAWTLVVVANLIVPLPFGLMCTVGGGRIGMGLAIVAWWVAGLWICRHQPDRARWLIHGGIILGLSQITLMPQVLAGLAALRTWEEIAVGEGEFGLFVGGESELFGFVVTAITGAELLLLAFVAGQFLAWISPRDPESAKVLSRESSTADELF
jgi:hypothetical protein